VQKKASRLGVNVVVHPPSPSLQMMTTSAKLETKELITVQRALEILAAALEKSVNPGLDSIEIQRLNAISKVPVITQAVLTPFISSTFVTTSKVLPFSVFMNTYPEINS
jgi:hypothetical protein